MSWNESRTIVEAYGRLRHDFPSLADAWIVDEDAVMLLNAQYNFREAQRGSLFKWEKKDKITIKLL